MVNFITREPVPVDAPELYVERPTDAQFDRYLRHNDYIAVIGPRLSGKTSLLVRKYNELSGRQRDLPIYINLSLLATLSGAAWYERLHTAILQGMRQANRSDADERSLETRVASDELQLRDALLKALEGELHTRNLILMLDDVEMIPKPILTPLMAMIREVFSSRGMIDAFKRCVFVLAGCFLPDDLIADPSISPFRIAERIHMMDASIKGVAQLTRLVSSAPTPTPPQTDWLTNQVYQWTEGDLYLTQRLCALLDEQPKLTPAIVDRVVENELTEDGIFERVIRYLERTPRLLTMLSGISSGVSPIRFTRLQRTVADAWLAGILKEDENGRCAIRNRVYQTTLRLSEAVNISLPITPSNHDQGYTQPFQTPPKGEKIILRERYSLEGIIGRGGMAQVHRATDLQTSQMVAVKQLLVELANDPAVLERFRREGELLRQLNHPNIVHFIDLFEEGDHPYIVMEFVSGGTLHQLLHREGRILPIPVAIQIGYGLAEALDHAHAHGVIHRDIKPGNVLLTLDYTPRLADFGVARIISKSRLTESGLALGTFPYMSPEGCSGEPVSASSDLWSVGVVMFEMLTGFLPFEGPNTPSTVHAIIHAPLPDIRQRCPAAPWELVKIIERLLSRDLGARFPSAGELAAALQPLLKL